QSKQSAADMIDGSSPRDRAGAGGETRLRAFSRPVVRMRQTLMPWKAPRHGACYFSTCIGNVQLRNTG
ncbi:MAG TPA: hypothetical protein VE844_14600, partial [Gammaproteobacteria bacterium]|nr:hypothetical protein [Gammaproteobacteria bacterium]